MLQVKLLQSEIQFLMLYKMFENFIEEFLSLPLLWAQSHIEILLPIN